MDSRAGLDAAVREARISEGMVTTDQLANAISSAKNQLITPENYAQAGSGLWKPIVERVYPVYQRRLLTANAVGPVGKNALAEGSKKLSSNWFIS